MEHLLLSPQHVSLVLWGVDCWSPPWNPRVEPMSQVWVDRTHVVFWTLRLGKEGHITSQEEMKFLGKDCCQWDRSLQRPLATRWHHPEFSSPCAVSSWWRLPFFLTPRWAVWEAACLLHLLIPQIYPSMLADAMLAPSQLEKHLSNSTTEYCNTRA